MNVLDTIKEHYSDIEFLSVVGFDTAIIGVDESSMRLVYSVSKCVEQLHQNGMPLEQAIEYFEFNIMGAFVGDSTPIFCYDIYDEFE